jgi:hypothetical protein
MMRHTSPIIADANAIPTQPTIQTVTTSKFLPGSRGPTKPVTTARINQATAIVRAIGARRRSRAAPDNSNRGGRRGARASRKSAIAESATVAPAPTR